MARPGRKSRYAEPTVPIRVPISLVPLVQSSDQMRIILDTWRTRLEGRCMRPRWRNASKLLQEIEVFLSSSTIKSVKD
jgi:hypothetical protein